MCSSYSSPDNSTQTHSLLLLKFSGMQPSKSKIQQNSNSMLYSNSLYYFIPKYSTSHDVLPSCIQHLPEGRARLVSENPKNNFPVFLIMKVLTVTTYPSSSSIPRVVELEADAYTVLRLQTA